MSPEPQDRLPWIDPNLRVLVVTSGASIVLGVGGLILGAFGGGLGAWLTGGSLVGTGLIMLGSWWFAQDMQRHVMSKLGHTLRNGLPAGNETLRETGRPGTAVLLTLADTGTSVNDNPLVHFTVRVHPIDGSPFLSTFTNVVSRIAVPRAGDYCPVHYDREDRSQLLMTGPFVNGPFANGQVSDSLVATGPVANNPVADPLPMWGSPPP